MIRFFDVPDFSNFTTEFKGRVNLGNIVITGGSVVGITDITIADGGTGASTALAALTNLINGTSLTSATVAGTDKVLIQDTSDTDSLKTITVQSIADLITVNWSAAVDSSIVADTDSTYNLGSSAVRFADLYVDDITVTTNITVAGTVDGRNVSTDGTKLDTLVNNIDQSFRAYLSGANAVAATTATVVVLNNEDFDENATFDSTTNYRHTPTVAGTYMYVGAVTLTSLADGKKMRMDIRKNGTAQVRGHASSVGSTNTGGSVTTVVKMNGSTDYVDLAVYHDDSVSRNLTAAAYANYLSGFLVG